VVHLFLITWNLFFNLKKILNGDEDAASAEAFDEWGLLLTVDQQEVKQKLKENKSFLYDSKLLKSANIRSAHIIVGRSAREYYESVSAWDAVNAIDYCNKVKAEVEVWRWSCCTIIVMIRFSVRDNLVDHLMSFYFSLILSSYMSECTERESRKR
jgi:hypothetical protein